MTLLVMTALESELDRANAPPGIEIVYTGVGKINAALATAAAIARRPPRLVVNYGTAGRVDGTRAGLLEIAHVVQRDMMAMPLAPRGTTPFWSGPATLSSGHGDAVCGTGDSFVTAADPWLADAAIAVVDMELYAIAHVCAHYGVPWRAFKFITDDANETAHRDWAANLKQGERLFWDRLAALAGAP